MKQEIISEFKDYQRKTTEKAFGKIDYINQIISNFDQEKRNIVLKKEQQKKKI